jgi:hypothetical protein
LCRFNALDLLKLASFILKNRERRIGAVNASLPVFRPNVQHRGLTHPTALLKAKFFVAVGAKLF